MLGFETREDAAVVGVPGHVTVYLPQSYDFAGQLIIVPGDQIEHLALASSDAMAFIVSGGVTGLGAGGERGTTDQ